jgi:hypothetical protein
MSDYVFNYNPNVSYNSNFVEWRTLNSEERSAFNEAPLTLKEAEEIFARMFGKFANSVDLQSNQ